MSSRQYSRDEAQAILARAVERQHGQGDNLSHQDLLAIGRELGVSSEAIEAAAAGVGDDLAIEREVRARIARARRAFLLHLVPYLMVMALLVTINLMTTPGFLWFLFPALGWGVGLASHAIVALAPDRESTTRKVRRRMEREREKERERARKRERGALEEGARRVAKAVQDRTAEVLHDVADALEATGPAPKGGSKVRVDEPTPEPVRRVAARHDEGNVDDDEDEDEKEVSRRRAP